MAELRIMAESIVSPVFNSVSFFRLFPFLWVTPCAQLRVPFSRSSPSWPGHFCCCFHVSPGADQHRSPFVRRDFIVTCVPAYIARPFALLCLHNVRHIRPRLPASSSPPPPALEVLPSHPLSRLIRYSPPHLPARTPSLCWAQVFV